MASLEPLDALPDGGAWELHRGPNTLGRDPDNDFPLDDGTISARHCELIVTDFGVRVRDLGSTNGTFLDGERVTEAVARDGQVLALGSFRARLAIPPPRVAVPELPPPPPLPPATLADGTPVCSHHARIPATRRCRQCARTYCDECAREMRLVGGATRWLCPVCSGACGPLGPPVAAKPRSFAQRLVDTLRIGLRATAGRRRRRP